jgi:Flp pilus assembly protein TadG
MRAHDYVPPHRRRGAALVEAAIVLPFLFLFLIGTITIGMGIFRYQQVAALAREGARYAAVHGTQYAADTGNTAATYTDIYNNAILPKATGLVASDIVFNSGSVTWSLSNSPTSATSTGASQMNTVSVTVTYNWTPERYIIGTIALKSTSVMPMAY